LAWFLVTDPVKLIAYRLLDPTTAGQNVSASRQVQGFGAQALPAGQ
jgi:membrane protein required for beta-lactamase induction